MAEETLKYQINMAQAFALAFGVGQIPLRYQVPEADNTQAGVNYSGMPEITPDEVKYGQSWLGTPIHFKFALKGGLYRAYDLEGNIEEREMQELQMPLSTMVEFSRAKRIKTTPTVGGYGTVKEMYGFEDWSIRIRGICLNDPSHPQHTQAEDQRNAIQRFEDLADAINLVEDDNIFTQLGIYSLVIRSVNFPSIPGRPNYLPFELNCVSDKPLELIL